ncbi:hypothetical protein [uncultured Clostridium sp.]|uniref:hypothetical protein n=1 Tax=uncultured Clostridium sp. TaxID=59620 RepID=UPI002618E018|nr:hypothetical protein [uncultured Clostridium sp.]
MDLNYIRKINGTYGKTCRQSIIDDMLAQYEEANKNIVTEFDVLINSSKAKKVFIDNAPTKVLMEYKNNKNTSDSKFMWEVKNYPNLIKTGSYLMHINEVTEEEDYYICMSKSMNKRGYDVNYFRHCNQRINISADLKIPCIAEGESYGVKIFSSNNALLSDVDTKIKVTVQRNSITENIALNTRFIFGNSKMGIYVVGDISTYNNNLLTFTCKKDKYIEGYDDIENGIAYNEDLPSVDDQIKPIKHIISGADSIRKEQIETYKINNPNGEWEIEDWSNSVKIIDQDNSQIKLKCNVYGDFITLKYLVGDKVVIEKDISLVR